MIVGGLMKRLLRQIPVDIPGERGKTTNLASQISNLFIRMKERTSIKPIYAETFSVDLGLEPVLEDHVDKTMNLVIDYDAHCEKLE
jgi:hypothetical protein